MKKHFAKILASFLAVSAFQPEAVSQIPPSKRILVVGGGGARGAWGGGYAKFLTEKNGGPYKVVFGTSTGSLMAPLIVLNKFDKLKTAYTTVNQKSIFNVNPFNEDGELKAVKAIWRFVRNKQTLGETQNLRKLIDKFLTLDEYNEIRAQKLTFAVTVVDLKTGDAFVKSSADIAEEQKMKNWMWASGNEPLFMSYYNDGGDHAYVDGGVLENVPLKAALQYAIDNDFKAVDVIINKPKDPVLDKTYAKRGIFSGLLRLIELWTLEIRNDDLIIPQLEEQAQRCRDLGVKNDELTRDQIEITLHYFPADLFKKPKYSKELLFDEKRMQDMWTVGESGQEDPIPTEAALVGGSTRTFSLPKKVIESIIKQ